MRELRTQVLVIGGGGAACRAAIAACDAGAEVILASKREVGAGGATVYPVAEMAGYNAADPAIPGSVEAHFEDIVHAGQGMADERLAAVLAAQAPETIDTLEKWGVEFEKEGDGYYIFKSCFASVPRTHVIRGHGEPIMRAMARQIQMRNRIRVMADVTVIELIVVDGRCCGAWGMGQDGELSRILAGAVVLATGGATQAFEKNLNPVDVSGDGYLLGYGAGAELVNMEFMQAGIGFSHPVVNMFNAYIWAAHPKLTDGEGREFLPDDLPSGLGWKQVMDEHRKHFPFSSSDPSKYLEIAIQKQIKAGGTGGQGGVVCDLSHLTPDYVSRIPDDCGIHHMWAVARDYMMGKGVDLLKERTEISVFAHAINGGVRINEQAASTIPGLYAAGEVAGGPHGADRLGGNMMVTCQVFGNLAGRYAARWAKQHSGHIAGPEKPGEEILFLLQRQFPAAEAIRGLQRMNQENLLVCRNEVGLGQVLEYVSETMRQIRQAPGRGQPDLEVFRLLGLLASTRLMAQAAKDRRESRGAHYREDYPEKSAQFESWKMQKRDGQRMEAVL